MDLVSPLRSDYLGRWLNVHRSVISTGWPHFWRQDMIFKNPLPFDSWSPSRFEEIQNTETSPEIPAVRPDTSQNTRVPFVLDTATNPCPYWHIPEPKHHIDLSKIDYEKLAGRVLLISMGLFTLLLAFIMLWKIFVMALYFK